MQRLILMRHAKAEGHAPSGEDFDRPLAPRGMADATRMGRALAHRGLKPDRALVSGALRTRQTWDQVHEGLGDVEVTVLDDLYEAGPEVLRTHIEAEAEVAGCLMLVGHNPGVHLLAMELLMEGAAAPSVLERLSSGFPTGMAVVFSVDVAERYALEGVIRPSDLDADAG